MDKTEFTARVSACENALKRYVYYKLPSKADAEDILQETMLTAYLQQHTLKNPDGFKPWILRIAANKCNDFYRKYMKRQESPIENDAVLENALSRSRYGLTVAHTVQETLAQLNPNDSQILGLFYIQRLSQEETSCLLKIPTGTVKSRLHTAKQRFKRAYPYRPTHNSKGERKMRKLPDILPEYTIRQSSKAPFPVKWEEMMGWFIVPKIGEKLTWGMYDWPAKKLTERCEMEVVGRASVHGIEGVEIVTLEFCGGQHEEMPDNCNITRTFVAQLADTHCRLLAESHCEGGVKRLYTFLDADVFLQNWGFGEDNCGKEVNLAPKGLIHREGNKVTIQNALFLLDVVGRYTVTINSKTYDCICVMDIDAYDRKVLTEQFIDKNGRTVLWRRFNRDDWNMHTYKQPWSEKLPANEQLVVDGKLYVHWYDCISDYIM